MIGIAMEHAATVCIPLRDYMVRNIYACFRLLINSLTVQVISDCFPSNLYCYKILFGNMLEKIHLLSGGFYCLMPEAHNRRLNKILLI